MQSEQGKRPFWVFQGDTGFIDFGGDRSPYFHVGGFPRGYQMEDVYHYRRFKFCFVLGYCVNKLGHHFFYSEKI